MKWGDVVEASLECYLDKHDLVRKAERSKKRKTLASRVGGTKTIAVQEYDVHRRVPVTAAQKHAVIKRDQGKCTHIGADGKRCNSDKWLDTHHIIAVSRGGTNDLENLTTLIWMTKNGGPFWTLQRSELAQRRSTNQGNLALEGLSWLNLKTNETHA